MSRAWYDTVESFHVYHIYMVFFEVAVEGFFEIAVESWPE